jgi:hypothetical protein
MLSGYDLNVLAQAAADFPHNDIALYKPLSDRNDEVMQPYRLNFEQPLIVVVYKQYSKEFDMHFPYTRRLIR